MDGQGSVIRLVPKPAADPDEAAAAIRADIVEFLQDWQRRVETDDLKCFAIVSVGRDHGMHWQMIHADEAFAAMVTACELLKKDIIDNIGLEREPTS